MPNGLGSGKGLLVGTNPLTGEVTTVIRSSKNLINKRFIPINMRSRIELIKILQCILEAESPSKDELIREFQEEVWNDESVQDSKLNEVLSELAYDLDFYESNDRWRENNLGYYGNDKLKNIMKNAIQKLKE